MKTIVTLLMLFTLFSGQHLCSKLYAVEFTEDAKAAPWQRRDT